MSTTLDADAVAVPPPAGPAELSVAPVAAAPAAAAAAAPKRPRAPARERTFGTKVGGQPAFV
ncbi:MAG: hypothetical protein ACEQSK_16305, partial [Sphingomonadaceae bacterium]